jgi:hypothetical protein
MIVPVDLRQLALLISYAILECLLGQKLSLSHNKTRMRGVGDLLFQQVVDLLQRRRCDCRSHKEWRSLAQTEAIKVLEHELVHISDEPLVCYLLQLI